MNRGNKRTPFSVLLRYYVLMFESIEQEKVLPAVTLIKIRGQIEKCDTRFKNDHQRFLIYASTMAWKECHYRWNLNTPIGEENTDIRDVRLKHFKPRRTSPVQSTSLIRRPPDKVYDYDKNLSENDKKFLRSLRIQQDETKKENKSKDGGTDEPQKGPDKKNP